MGTPIVRILIVDDDAALLKVMNNYLSRLGYRVDACGTAAEALKLMQAEPAEYTRALVDLNLPGMTGRELAERLLAASASIRLVIVSGYPAAAGGTAGLDGQRVQYLNKPFAPKQLADVLRG